MKRSLVAVAVMVFPAAVIVLLVAIGMLLSESCTFLKKSCKAMEGEGKHFAQTSNRAQQSYYLEHKKFASSSEALELGAPAKTRWYEYSFQNTPTSAFFYAVPIGDKAAFRMGYVGAVFLNKKAGREKTNREDIPLTITCEAKGPKAILTVKPMLKNGLPACSEGSAPLKNENI